MTRPGAAPAPPTAQNLPGEVSGPMAPLVHGPLRTGRIVATTRHALYATTGDPALPAIALVTRDALRVPNAVVLPTASPARPFDSVRQGDTVVIGHGRVRCGVLSVVAGRSWAPPRAQDLPAPCDPRRAPELTAHLDRLAGPASPGIAAPLAALREALLRAEPAAVPDTARALVGLGPGLTPSGDDILCGILLAIHPRPTGQAAQAFSRRSACREALVAATASAADRTPLVSAAMLAHAARGECLPQVFAALEALATGRPLLPALTPLLAVGHHSGADLARGVATALATAREARGAWG